MRPEPLLSALALIIGTACRLGFDERIPFDGAGAADRGAPGLLSAYLAAVNQPAPPSCPDVPVAQAERVLLVVSQQLDETTLVPGDFTVTDDRGVTTGPRCVTLAPAVETDEDNTIMLVGDFVPRPEVTIAAVTVVGPLRVKSGGSLTGARVDEVIGVAHSIRLVQAYATTAKDSEVGAPQGCPATTLEVVRATWSGDLRVTTPPADPLSAIVVRDAAGSSLPTLGVSFAEERDGDNILDICLATVDPPAMLEVAAQTYLAPNGLANPQTAIAIEL